MKVSNSQFLNNSKPIIKKLINILSESYSYVSVLGTDINSKRYAVNKMGILIGDGFLGERGFVVRVHNGVNYSEYSFNEISEDKLNSIVDEIKSKLNKVSEFNSKNSYEVINEEEIVQSYLGEVLIDPKDITSEEIINKLIAIKDEGLSYSDLIVNFNIAFETSHISKMFISNKKDLDQSYIISQCMMFSIARRENNTKYYYDSYSGVKGFEVVEEAKANVKKIVDQSIKLLDAKSVEPGEYDVICAPDITGLIAHEAFGHGVEMDMFVKERAKGAEYINKVVASNLTTMHDGAAAIKDVSSYLFDDEGTIGTDTVIIENGVLRNGISDLLSALKLGTIPTGNGKRESFERKAYSRMTNTFFEPGNDKVEDMIASVKKGYLIEKMYSGMEDPKNWGMQCIALVGREIIDGNLTGNLISPVYMTGFVPDILKSITMVSDHMDMEGSGYCGKGYKEFVKTSNGGPYIKAKVRLG